MPKALLLIADIGGYTRFMKVTASNLAHSQQMVADILEAVIDAAEDKLELAKLEGDAAFFYVPLQDKPPSAEELEGLFARMQSAFRTVIKQHAVDDMCDCDGCVKSDQLTIKFVAHIGEVAYQKVKNFKELAGVDVIVIHRMLKNDVPIKEYVLFTEPLVPVTPPSLKSEMNALKHDFEGIGETQTYYAALTKLPVVMPEVKKRPFVVRFFSHLGFMLRSLPYLLRLRRRPVADVVAPRHEHAH